MRGAFGAGIGRDYLALARSLGSDVPFFLVETAALVEGTGERVTAAGPLPPWWVVLVAPAAGVNTGEAFAALAARRAGGYQVRARNTSPTLAALEALQRADFAAVAAAAQNDFEDVVGTLVPDIPAALGALRSAGARLVRLSGSGSTCFGLCETEGEARRVEASLALPHGARSFVVPLMHSEAWTPTAAR